MKILILPPLVLVIVLSCCTTDHLRGSAKPSKDGKTYLVVSDDNGGACGPLLVDGKKWPYKINEPGIIEPGTHSITYGGTIEFNIPEGVVFTFDYWGP